MLMSEGLKNYAEAATVPHLKEMEKKLMINFHYQEKIMNKGFYSQGEAFYRCGEYQRAYQWCEKGFQFLKIRR